MLRTLDYPYLGKIPKSPNFMFSVQLLLSIFICWLTKNLYWTPDLACNTMITVAHQAHGLIFKMKLKFS